ncbi:MULTISPECIES: AAA family ATPase [Bacillus cereus group]|uniref:AAA family ATPase n=1 Tax=Bacillus cereus group TaxID=86661 RepID=UPI0018F52335|nr:MULTISPECIES: AAA family ATPase [Bacillus cereus group]MBJ8031913.1 ATP-dependent Clp protease ATP-binding subunit [Bacillus cereus group sp. N21]MDF2082089.1 AAA family ATPase [Bacillus pseudomycoides]
MRFVIFNGPTEEFKKIIPNEYTTSLTPIVRSMDLLHRIQGTEQEQEYYQALSVFTDEYSSVADHFIEGFVIHILNYASHYLFEEVYLNNPPTKIVEQLNNPNLGISVEKIEFNHAKLTLGSLKEIKEQFDESVFGQEKVKNELLQTLYPLTNNGAHKPVVIMLYGPSGVGKTETAKLINSIIYGQKELFRKQLSMYHNESFGSYIFGDKANSFSKDLIDRQTNVLLLDEFDKASPIFYSAFYQMFDEGEFTDKYYNVKLEDSIIICTSNFNNEKEIKDRLGSAIFSRFDNLIEYYPLSTDAKRKIIQTTYNKEISKFNKEDREFLEKENMIAKMESFLDYFQNARDIQKAMKRLLTYPLIQRL